ncbi:MAG: fibronectin type III, partial [Lutibacter sp.]|nr:fibronectin type III [Lutibacter sp.]
SSLSLIGSDQTAASLVSPTLSASTSYYWNVVVKDGQGGQTIGQVWSFTTD